MKRVTKEEEGIVGQMEAASHTSLVGRCVWVRGVVFPSEPLWRLLFQAAPVMLAFRGFQLDLLGSRHLKSTPTLRRWE